MKRVSTALLFCASLALGGAAVAQEQAPVLTSQGTGLTTEEQILIGVGTAGVLCVIFCGGGDGDGSSTPTTPTTPGTPPA